MFTMGIDQYGQHYDSLGQYPRKALLEQLHCKHADKMYVDTKSGETKHIGYIISGLWIRIFNVSEWLGKLT